MNESLKSILFVLKIAAMDEEDKSSVSLSSKSAKQVVDYIDKLENKIEYYKNLYTTEEETQIYKK